VTYVGSPNTDTVEARKLIWTPSGSRRGPEICTGRGPVAVVLLAVLCIRPVTSQELPFHRVAMHYQSIEDLEGTGFDAVYLVVWWGGLTWDQGTARVPQLPVVWLESPPLQAQEGRGTLGQGRPSDSFRTSGQVWGRQGVRLLP